MLGGTIRSPDDFEDGDFRKYAPRFSAENFPKNLQLVDKITEIAKKKGCTASQLTLAWILAQGDDFFPVGQGQSPLEIRCELIVGVDSRYHESSTPGGEHWFTQGLAHQPGREGDP